jgi:hypothetical protein
MLAKLIKILVWAKWRLRETTFKSGKPGALVDANSNSAELAKLRLGRHSSLTIVQHCNLNRKWLCIRTRVLNF